MFLKSVLLRISDNLFGNINLKNYKIEILVSISFLVFSYGLYFGVSREQAIRLTDEDNLFENLTAGLFFLCSMVFCRTYFLRKNIFFIALAILFFLGFGEEISWGQRIFGIATPDAMSQSNLQQEMNLHNLQLFHPQDAEGISKSGLRKLITADFLYNLFWFTWCIVLPISTAGSQFISSFAEKIKLPVPVFPLSILFLINFLLFYTSRSTLSVNKSDFYYSEFREVYECVSAMIFFMISISLYKSNLSSSIDR